MFSPSGYRDRLPLPLVVFFHNEVDNPTAIHRRTRLRKRYGKLDLSGDPERPGFLILAPQARRIGHLLRFDTDYTAADNVDIETVDKFIDKLVAAGEVDSERIYAIGEARGGEMAALYAMVRSDRIAAFATFATDASPFRWNCAGTGPPAAILYRACDAKVPCLEVERWIDARRQRGVPTFPLRLSSGKALELHCAVSKCGPKTSLGNHRRWPKPREADMLDYLGQFRLKSGG